MATKKLTQGSSKGRGSKGTTKTLLVGTRSNRQLNRNSIAGGGRITVATRFINPNKGA